jgi:hypothetical protein
MLKETIMKKTVILLVFLITQLASCQTIVPLSTLNNINGVYIKDINNTFLPYLGTWEGVSNNKKYTFVFVKFTKYMTTWGNGGYEYRDELKAKFKVTDLTTGNILYDNTSVINHDDYIIFGTNPNPSRGICAFYFKDTDANCQNEMEFTLMNVTGQPNKLKYCYFNYTDWWRSDLCTYTNRLSIPVFLPQNDFILTKLP